MKPLFCIRNILLISSKGRSYTLKMSFYIANILCKEQGMYAVSLRLVIIHCPHTICCREELEVQQAAYLKQLDKFELENLGNFRRIYPRPGMEHYDKFFHSSGSLFQETAAYKARSEAAR